MCKVKVYASMVVLQTAVITSLNSLRDLNAPDSIKDWTFF